MKSLTIEIPDNINEDQLRMSIGANLFDQGILSSGQVIAVDVDHGDNFDDGFMEALFFDQGCYYRLVANSNGVNTTLINAECTSVNTSDLVELDVFTIIPNLFHDVLTIQFPSSNPEGKVYIHTILGELKEAIDLQSIQNHTTVNTSGWNEGTYIISLQYEDQVSSKKAVKY